MSESFIQRSGNQEIVESGGIRVWEHEEIVETLRLYGDIYFVSLFFYIQFEDGPPFFS